MKSVCIFCGSQNGRDPAYQAAARELGTALARRGLGLVYGGGGTGLMGTLADAVLAAGGEVQGVIPGALVERELAHPGLTRLHVVASMHERKATMARLADAFVALPGGMGTLEELAETLTWIQLGIHARPCAVLDVKGYWSRLLEALDHFVEEGFLRAEHRALLMVAQEPEALLDALRDWRPPTLRQWLDPSRT